MGAGVPGLLEPGFELSATEWLPWFVKAIGLTVASIGSHWKYRSENEMNLHLVTEMGHEWLEANKGSYRFCIINLQKMPLPSSIKGVWLAAATAAAAAASFALVASMGDIKS